MNDIPEDSRQLDTCISCGGDMYTESAFSICDECNMHIEEEKESVTEEEFV